MPKEKMIQYDVEKKFVKDEALIYCQWIIKKCPCDLHDVIRDITKSCNSSMLLTSSGLVVNLYQSEPKNRISDIKFISTANAIDTIINNYYFDGLKRKTGPSRL